MKCIIRCIIVVVLLLSSFDIGIGYVIRDEVDGCDCEDIGTWSPGTLTCTLTGDVGNRIEIDDDGITLDGNGYSATEIYVHENSGYIIENFVGTSPIRIEGLESHSDFGIIRGNAITGVVGESIDITDANYIEITDNTISHSTYIGISLSGSSNINITDNTLHDNTYGIDCSVSSHYNRITGNTIHDNTFDGVRCRDNSDYNIIIDNIIYNVGGGISVQSSREHIISDNKLFNNYRGIDFGMSYCNTINSNNISNNSYGIYMCGNNDNDGNNSIFCNNISSSSRYGIYIDKSKGNFLYHNNIVDSYFSNSYEHMETGSNQWYLGTTGNHWDDYDEPCESCVDSDDDGICDSPYDIPGSTGRDMYPLVCIDWRDEWMNANSDGGTKVTTIELQDAIHHWLEDKPIRCHVLSLADIQEVIAAWLLG